MKPKHHTVQIIGGGLAGLSLANALARHDIETLLVDAMPDPNTVKEGDGRTSALAETSVNFLQNLDLWHRQTLKANPIEKIRIVQTIPPYTLGGNVCFSANDVGRQYLAYNVDNHALRAHLCEKIRHSNSITHLYDTKIEDIKSTKRGWQLQTKDRIFSADVTVGADGSNSFSRQKVGIGVNSTDYRQTALVFTVEHSLAHNNTSTEFMYPEGAFTFVPMEQNTSAVIWIESSDTAKSYMGNKYTLNKNLHKKAQDFLGTLKITSNIQMFPLRRVMAKNSIARRLCLIAEAHHAITPVVAQGLNLSLRDSAVLAELLVNAHKQGGDVGSKAVLDTYARKRIPDIKTRDVATRIFHALSKKSDPLTDMGKTFTMGILNSVLPIKKYFIHLGLSIAGGTPTYMQKHRKL